VDGIRARKEVGIVYLDPDRAYPPLPISTQQYAEALERLWGRLIKRSSGPRSLRGRCMRNG
jgi:hypothetical protein